MGNIDVSSQLHSTPNSGSQANQILAIVKLFLRYEFGGADQWAHGTGWLIRPDILVTAGHCAYDWGHRLGRAVEVKAYIGYKGRDQLNDPNVQFRSESIEQ